MIGATILIVGYDEEEMPMGMTDKERRDLRRSQVERFLSTTMTMTDWCKLNHVAPSTMYMWMSRFRKQEPGMFAGQRASDWIELSREAVTAKTALARADSAAPAQAPAPDGLPGHAPHADGGMRAIIVRVNGAEVAVPAGSAQSDIAAVLRAVASV